MEHCNQEMSGFGRPESAQVHEFEHRYCRVCGAHFYEGKWYTADEWFFYINEETFELGEALESPHAHDSINHSGE